MAEVRSIQFQLAKGAMTCWSCGESTAVYAFVAPAGATAWDEEDRELGWQTFPDSQVLMYACNVSSTVAANSLALAPTFRIGSSQTAERDYWLNHCEHCAQKVGDFFTQNKLEGPFFSWHNAKDEVELFDLATGQLDSEMPYICPPEPARKRRP